MTGWDLPLCDSSSLLNSLLICFREAMAWWRIFFSNSGVDLTFGFNSGAEIVVDDFEVLDISIEKDSGYQEA